MKTETIKKLIRTSNKEHNIHLLLAEVNSDYLTDQKIEKTCDTICSLNDEITYKATIFLIDKLIVPPKNDKEEMVNQNIIKILKDSRIRIYVSNIAKTIII